MNGGIDEIAMYLNYDMVGSPNYVFFVYDGDESDASERPAGPPGSAAIEDVYEAYYTRAESPTRARTSPDVATTGVHRRSTSRPAASSPAPRASRRRQQAATWGGTAGRSTTRATTWPATRSTNNSDHVLEINSDLIAFAQLTFAFSTETVNGVPGRTVPGSSAP